MPPPLHVHLLGIGIVEAAIAQLAVEAEGFAVVAADLLNVVLPHGLHFRFRFVVGRLGGLLGLALGFVFVGAHRAKATGCHERDLRRAAYRLFGYCGREGQIFSSVAF